MALASPFPSEAGLDKPVCVFCGSSPGTSPLFTIAARSVGRALAASHVPLVYGGGRRGIMGVVSASVVEAGGYVCGIVPQALVERAAEHTPAPGQESRGKDALQSAEGRGKDVLGDAEATGRLTVEVVASMHERKRRMAELSTGGFIVLPGGYGTFEEMMEMVTWNQLGIHRLPVVVLNIGNLYTPLKALLQNAVSSGFIAEQNLSLLTIVDLPGGEAANADESKAEEWGPAALDALEQWSKGAGPGYDLSWTDKEEPKVNGGPPAQDTFSLFTTMRYTSPSSPTSSSSASPSALRPVQKADIPLLDAHLGRLVSAHAHFAERDGTAVWGKRAPTRDALWGAIREKIEEVEAKEGQGDWRVRVLVHQGGMVGVEMIPMPQGSAPFQWDLEETRPQSRRPIYLDPADARVDAEDRSERDFRLYKTTRRGIYDDSAKRGAARSGTTPTETLLHTSTHLLESTTSNVAIQQHDGTWLTPRLDPKRGIAFLDGVMRRWLLGKGVVREGDVGVDEWERAKIEGRRVIGLNGLRGVWEAEPR